MQDKPLFVAPIPIHSKPLKVTSSTSVSSPRRSSVRRSSLTSRPALPVVHAKAHTSQNTKMEIRMYVVNAFTAPNSSNLRAGNPAAVALLTDVQDAQLGDDVRQELAAEMNLSETAFVTRSQSGDPEENRFTIRWFTPATEVDLCGHATLAAARALADDEWVKGEDILFETKKKGTLRVHAREGELEMDFPALEKREELKDLEEEVLRHGLGTEVVESFRSDYDIVARVANAAVLAEINVSYEKLAELDTRGIIVTARGEDGVRFVSRFFAPRVGIEEDPVTGSAHCVLATMFLDVGETNVEARQVSARGGWLKIGRPEHEVVSIAGRTRVVWKGYTFL